MRTRFGDYRTSYDGSAYAITYAVQRLILFCAAVFAIQLVLDIVLGVHPFEAAPPGGIAAVLLSFRPQVILTEPWFAFWTPATYIFLHGSLLHLFMNMLWLFFFGPEVERALGTRQFLRFFVICGAVGVFATVPVLLMGASGAVSVVGASGAIMGVLLAFAIINPEREFFLFPLPVPINARALILIVVIMNVMLALGRDNTSVATHFGGMGTGYVYMKLVPRFRQWRHYRRMGKEPPKDQVDVVGEAVDNIFEFKNEKKRRR